MFDLANHQGENELSKAPTRASTPPESLEAMDCGDSRNQLRPDMLLAQLNKLRMSTVECFRPTCVTASPSYAAVSEPCAEERRDCLTLFALCRLFNSDPSSGSPDLDWAGFQYAFGTSSNAPLIKRIFDLIDCDRSGAVSADAFVRGLFPLYSRRASIAMKMHSLFSCFDLDGSGSISREDLLVALCGSLQQQCPLSLEQLEQVISHTFIEMDVDVDGAINWQDFSAYFNRRPAALHKMLQSLEFNVNLVTAELWLAMGEGWLKPRGGPASPAVTILD